MIYEKRGSNYRERQNEDYCVTYGVTKRTTPVEEYSTKSVKLYPSCVSQRDVAGKRRKRVRQKNHTFSKIILVGVTLLFCLFTLDNRLFEGRLYSYADEYASVAVKKARQALELCGSTKVRQENDVMSQYRVKPLMYDDGNDIIPPLPFYLANEDFNKSTRNAENKDTVAVAASQGGAAFADGVAFYPITEKDLSSDSVMTLSNATVYSPDMPNIYNTFPPALKDLSIENDRPLVLIVHTHACESYTQSKGMYPEGESSRSEDTEKNVVRVGKEIAHTLESYGIGTIHCRKLCDKESFIDAYNVSHDIVKEYLEEYPSIRIVLDVHRDAIIKQSKESIKPTASIGGQNYAQLMFVVGTGQSAHSHPDWEKNLSLAVTLQDEAQERYPDLFRPINLRSVPFNQWLSEGYLLLEVGSNSNTMDEALASAQAFAHTLSAVLNKYSVD